MSKDELPKFIEWYDGEGSFTTFATPADLRTPAKALQHDLAEIRGRLDEIEEQRVVTTVKQTLRVRRLPHDLK